MTPVTIGEPFRCEEHRCVDILSGLGPYIAVVNDPPWSGIGANAPTPVSVVTADDMDVRHLDSLSACGDAADEDAVVVGIGGGTALDTAKYIAWKRGSPLVQMPTITSVDAGFTDAIGVRIDGNVRYIGSIVPDLVTIDIELIGRAPARLNRAGIGDILSCHTGLFDWQLAVDAGHGPAWNDDLAELGARLLVELDDALADIVAVSTDGIRFLVDAYRRIGAACAFAGHSRFEEGSEHFWAYAYEHATGAHHVHGELISFATVALAAVQHNDVEFAQRIVAGSGAVAHPADLAIDEAVFVDTLMGLRSYARSQSLDIGVADLYDITPGDAAAAWALVSDLARAGPS
jgi:glycerol-1-phosphate dehydrogenase [NAD(P)+]